jgi:hypothetical protein
MTSLSVTSTTVARLSKKHRMYLRRVSPCSYFTIARSMRVPEWPIVFVKLLVNCSFSWSHVHRVLAQRLEPCERGLV